jgi:hypothetical protein
MCILATKDNLNDTLQKPGHCISLAALLLKLVLLRPILRLSTYAEDDAADTSDKSSDASKYYLLGKS